MSKNKGGFKELFYSKLMPKIYGIGASIVIVGALFKIQHYPFAGLLLGVGLGVEAVIFFLSAFEPKGHEPDWSKVYPELADDYEGPVATRRISDNQETGLTKKLDHMLESAKVGPELIDSLGKGMRNLSESVSQMTTISSASIATDEYTKNVREASKSLIDMNRSYGSTITALTEMSNVSKDAQQYHAQVQTVTKNLGALNAVYELELQDANSHLKAMNKFYGNISNAMESMSEASKESDQFKGELSKLTSNLTSLNRVYGSMLSAMKG